MWKLFQIDFDKGVDWEMAESRFHWLPAMKDVPQDARYHAEGNVLKHTKMVVEALISLSEFRGLNEQDQHILIAAALMHDIGKPSTTTINKVNGKTEISSPGHAVAGEKLVRSMLYKELPAPFEIREQVAHLVRYHSLPLWAIERNDPRKSIIQASLKADTRLLYILARADAMGKITDDHDEMFLKIELFKALCDDYDCFGKPYSFKSNYGRFLYLNKSDLSPDYVPFEDLKFTVFVMAGLPGSGKDTFIRNNLDVPVLSLDEIRRLHNISPTDRNKTGVVIQLAKERAKNYLRGKKSFVFNATNITREIRNRWLSIFLDYGARVKIIYLELPYEQLIERNQSREHAVPEKAVEKMITKLEIPSPDEAHDIDLLIQ
jgi:putative nucleotidyltransferase with HDIG domain